MYKDELLAIHRLLVYLMRLLRDIGAPDSYFEEYICLNISPHHIHRTVAEHRYAVLILARGISEALSGRDILPGSLSRRLGELAERRRWEVEASRH
jgi:hypothetical protein